jgi:hypothetical protein
MATPSVGRLDHIIKEFERLQQDTQEIFDHHVDYLKCSSPTVPFGTLKSREITGPAGSDINYVAALKILRRKITGEAT